MIHTMKFLRIFYFADDCSNFCKNLLIMTKIVSDTSVWSRLGPSLENFLNIVVHEVGL